MRQLIRQLPASAEFLIVITLAFGYAIYISLWWVNAPQPAAALHLDNQLAMRVIIEEAVILSLIILFLRARAYDFSRLNLQVSWLLTGFGVALWFVHVVAVMFSSLIFGALVEDPRIFEHVQFTSSVSLPIAAIMIVLNSIYEEAIVTGYVITHLRQRHDAAYAIGVSLLIRLLYHLYQGPIVAVHILPMGILYAWIYWRTGRLWPLVVAHSLWNVLAFATSNAQQTGA